MEIGIIGLGLAGKTTLFNALTRGHASLAGAPGHKPNLGIAKVPDQRLDRLGELFRPKKFTPAEVTYVDVPGAPEGLGKGAGISGEFLNRLQRADAILLVVRAFEDPSVPHAEGTVDAHRDLDTLELELAFSDMAFLERRLDRLEGQLKSSKAQERDAAQRERTLLGRIKGCLEEGEPLRAQALTPDEAKMIANYQFLTAKPLLVALNIDEGQLADEQGYEERLKERLKGPGLDGAAIAGKLEAELGQMSRDEEEEFRSSLGAGESGLSRVIRLSYRLLDLVSFFTVGPDEVRAWTITAGTPAVQAAGKIHSDIERGFIRAEVVPWDQLIDCGTIAEAKKRGLLRTEGKTYVVLDGEVVNYLFNV